MKQETRKKRVKEVGQAQQVTIVLKLGAKKDKTITRERGILTLLLICRTIKSTTNKASSLDLASTGEIFHQYTR